MKKFSKILSVLLCVAMLLGLAAVVGAEEATSATISFSSTENRTVFNTDQQVWVQNGITVTNDKASSTSNVADYSNPARFYKGSKLTIAYTGMTSIVVTCNNATYANALKDSITGVTATADSAVVTVEFEAAVDSFVIEALSAQVRVDSITVYSKTAGEGGEEEVDPTTAGLVTDLSKLADGDQIVIVAVESAKALGTTQNTNNRAAVDVVKSDDLKTVTLTEETQVITLEKDAETGRYMLKVGEDQYLYAASSSSNWLRTASKADAAANGEWTIAIRADGVATIKAQGENTRNWLRNNNNLFACYGSGQKDVAIYKVGYAGDLPGEVKGTPATVVEAKAAANDAYLEVKGVVTNVYYNSIYIQDSTGAIKVTLNANASCKMGDTVVVTATKNGDILDGGTYVLSEGMTLTATETTLDKLSTFDVGTYVEVKDVTVSEVIVDDEGAVTGYTLTDGTNSISCSKSIEAIDGTLTANSKVASVKFTIGISKEVLVIWNSTVTVGTSNPGEGEDKPGEGEDKPGEGEDKPGDKTTVTVTAGTKTDSLVNGDKIIIYYPEGDTVIGDTADGSKLTPVAAKWSDKYLLYADGMAEFTVAIDNDGYYTFICNGKYLTSAETGNGLSLEDSASDLSLWTLEATDGGYFVKNKAAAYNDNPQYLEHYKGFTTYGKSASANPAYYTFQFYKLGEVEIEIDAPSQTGDVNLSVVVALMAVSALSVTALVAKKKEF